MTEPDLLNHPLIEQRYFFPRPDPVPDPFWVQSADVRLACAYQRLSPDTKSVVHFHGNGEVAADYLGGFTHMIGGLGCNCLLAEYRGYGASSGRPQLGRMLDDVPAIVESVETPRESIVLFGRSVGSLFALKAAELFPNVAGLILESAIADLLERLLLRVRPEEMGTTRDHLAETIAARLDIRSILQNFSRPLLILHTRNDGLVDVKHAERLAGWAKGPVTLEIFPRGDHNTILFVNAPRYGTLIRDFLADLG